MEHALRAGVDAEAPEERLGLGLRGLRLLGFWRCLRVWDFTTTPSDLILNPGHPKALNLGLLGLILSGPMAPVSDQVQAQPVAIQA